MNVHQSTEYTGSMMNVSITKNFTIVLFFFQYKIHFQKNGHKILELTVSKFLDQSH